MIMDHCVYPPELDDRQLIYYLDGERRADVVAHLEGCLYCRERSHKLAQMQNNLTTQLYRLTCPSSLELGDYVLGVTAGRQSRSIAEHLRDCPHCTQEVDQLRDYIKDLSPAPRPNPLEQARVLIARVIGGIEPGGLTMAPAYATVRGGSPGPITLQADGILIILEVQPSAEGRVDLIGQLASDQQELWISARVELFENGELLASDSVSDIGGFRFEGILPEAVELKITPLRGPVVLANIEIAT
jgi:hypothetical protein